MVRHSKGYRTRSRSLLSMRPREHGMQGLSRMLRKYEIGNRVLIDLFPSMVRGMPHRRYHGKMGTVVEKRGRAYILEVRIGGKIRKIISRPEHMRPMAA